MPKRFSQALLGLSRAHRQRCAGFLHHGAVEVERRLPDRLPRGSRQRTREAGCIRELPPSAGLRILRSSQEPGKPRRLALSALLLERSPFSERSAGDAGKRKISTRGPICLAIYAVT